MRSVGVFVIGALLHTVSAEGTRLAITYISPEQIKDIGGEVVLQCTVEHGEDYPVLWMKMNGADQVPISSRTALILRDKRFFLRNETTDVATTYSLQIKNIQESDVGFYQCQVVMSISEKISAQVELKVRKGPLISDNSTRSVIVVEGSDLKLECYASGFPTPKISWRRRNNAILPIGGSIYRGNQLKITSVRKEDRGIYYCFAENGVGRGQKRDVNVEVKFAPVITAPQPRVGQALKYDMNLECHIEAYPPPVITWHKNNIQLSNNEHYSISNFATADQYTETTLRIITIEQHQYGEYVCKAQNKLGLAETKVQLYEIFTPNINYPVVLWASGHHCNPSKWLIAIIGMMIIGKLSVRQGSLGDIIVDI